MQLLTIGNPKTAKGARLGYHTAVLHLAPSDLSGIMNVCPRATKGCIAGCLNTAGRGGIIKRGETTNAIQEARKTRTLALVWSPDLFASQLEREILAHERTAIRLQLMPAIRLNGTSDLDWSTLAGDVIRRAVMRGVTFYDYTKVRGLSARYHAAGLPIHLTFSRAETDANKRDASKVLAEGGNVAVVFKTKKGQALPETFEGVRVIDGDAHDLRFMDPAGVVVGLRAKGKARGDNSGFAVAEAQP